MINTLWFIILALMLTMYAVLDGFDLGVGALHLWVGRTDDERGRAIGSIGPVWNGNEVWLIASGGSMVVAFPHLYASAFSGFYLALMLVLWLLILRGIGIELRHQVDDPLWRQAWDVTFSGASALLAVLFGVALGNVMRGVPFDANGEFLGSFALLLNPFALLGGVVSLVLLSLHGAAYLFLKTDGAMQARARRAIGVLWWVGHRGRHRDRDASFRVRPDFTANFLRWPWLMICTDRSRSARCVMSAPLRGARRRTRDVPVDRRADRGRCSRRCGAVCFRCCCRRSTAAARIPASTSTTPPRRCTACASRSASTCSG